MTATTRARANPPRVLIARPMPAAVRARAEELFDVEWRDSNAPMSDAEMRSALALYDAIGLPDVALKWPNDVLLNGGKVAGILLESAGLAGGQVSHIAIGIGVNLIDAPQTEQVETTAVAPVSLAGETGVQMTPEEFLGFLAPAYQHYETQFITYGFDPIREAWLARAARLGEVITARTTRDEYVGRFETVDAQGNLVLSTAKSREVIPAAEIFF